MSVPEISQIVKSSRFQPWLDHGHLADLLFIIPPEGVLSPFTALDNSKRGKTPGTPTEDGWVGTQRWTLQNVSRETLALGLRNLQGAPYSIGLQARRLHGLDVDTKDRGFAEAVHNASKSLAAYTYGVRFGRRPGFLSPFRPETPRRKLRLVFHHHLTGEQAAVELLGVGQQYVVDGDRFPGVPYTWHPGWSGCTLPAVAWDARPALPDGLLDDWLTDLPGILENVHWGLDRPATRAPLYTDSGGANVSPGADLAPDLDQLKLVLEYLPNFIGNHRTREDQVRVCHALVGASGKQEAGRDVFLAWSAQWDDSAAAQDHANRIWEGVDPGATRLGWRWLCELAEHESRGRLTLTAADDFTELEPAPEVLADDNPFDKILATRPSAEDCQRAIADLSRASTDDERSEVLQIIACACLGKSVEDSLLRQIKATTGATLAELRAEVKMYARHLDPHKGDVTKHLADIAHNHFGKGLLAYHRGDWYHYDGKVWRSIHLSAVLQPMLDALQHDEVVHYLAYVAGRVQPAATLLAHASKHLETLTFGRLQPTLTPEYAMRGAVNLNNGTLWVDPATQTMQFKKHHADDLMMHLIPYDHDPKADCPRIKALLADSLSKTAYTILPGEPEYQELRNAIELTGATEALPYIAPDKRRCWLDGRQIRVVDTLDLLRMMAEIAGYMLVPWRAPGHILILKGNGRNGKSAFMKAMAHLMPGRALISGSVNSLNENFGVSELVGARVFYDDDADKRLFLRTGALKKVSENKELSAPVKFERNITFITTSFIVISTNHSPYCEDFTDAIRDRLIFLEFNRTFTIDERRSNPWEDVLTDEREMSGLINWCVAGLMRVMQRKRIQGTPATHQAHMKWMNLNSPEREFMSECCQRTAPTERQSVGDHLSDLYIHYSSWYAHNIGERRNMRGRNRFAEELRQLGLDVFRGHDGQLRVRGVWLKSEITDSNFAIGDFGRLDPEQPDAD